MLKIINVTQLGIVPHACIPVTWEVEVEDQSLNLAWQKCQTLSENHTKSKGTGVGGGWWWMGVALRVLVKQVHEKNNYKCDSHFRFSI
jgi:hypothetical protein